MGTNTSFPEVPTVSSASASSSKPQTNSRLSQSYTVSESDLTFKEKKKKASKFATLRKKFRVRRHSRSFDYGRALRELVNNWSIRDLSALVHEYEALVALKELAISTNLSRPPANTFRQDLSSLYDFKYCADVDLIFKGVCFPAHRGMLSMRSPFFRDILSRRHETYTEIPVKLRTQGVDVVLFSLLLQYLYTNPYKLTVNFNTQNKPL